MLSLEGMEPLGYDPGLIDVFCSLGVRMASLTWNRRNPFADGVAEAPAGGLSRIGRALVDRMAGPADRVRPRARREGTFCEVLERTGDRPVLVSHALCRALQDIPRNLTDDQLRALAERDGVVGLMALPFVVHEHEWTLARLIDHVDHLAQTVGVRHVCLGGDFARQLERLRRVRRRGAGLRHARSRASAAPRTTRACSRPWPRAATATTTSARSASDNLVRVLRRALPGPGSP